MTKDFINLWKCPRCESVSLGGHLTLGGEGLIFRTCATCGYKIGEEKEKKMENNVNSNDLVRFIFHIVAIVFLLVSFAEIFIMKHDLSGVIYFSLGMIFTITAFILKQPDKS